MSSSYIKFNNKGFWGNDSGLEVWFLLLIEEIKRHEVENVVLNDFCERLEEIIPNHGMGCFDPYLDKYLLPKNSDVLLHKYSDTVLQLIKEKYLNKSCEEVFISEEYYCLTSTVEKIGREFCELLAR